MFIGLMGVDSDNVLYAPGGRRLFKVPEWAGWRIQRAQHWVARLTWKKEWKAPK